MRRAVRGTATVLVLAPMALAACGQASPPSVMATGNAGTAAITLAKIPGHAPGLDPGTPEDWHFAVLEIAYDTQTAEALWDASGVDELPAADGQPREPGRYGSLDGVDLEEYVVALWSSGESGTCPGWLASIENHDGRVVLHSDEYATQPICTDVYIPYRTVVALPRDQVPTAEELRARTPSDKGVMDPHPDVELPVALLEWTSPSA